MMNQSIVRPNSPIFYKDTGFDLGIVLTKEQVDVSKIEDIAKSHGFHEQTFRHITILSSENHGHVFSSRSLKEQNKARATINTIIQTIDWRFSPQGIYHVDENVSEDQRDFPKEQRESYISVVDMPGAKQFIQSFNVAFGVSVPHIFPHITLFSKGESERRSYRGIPIPSAAAFQSMITKKVA